MEYLRAIKFTDLKEASKFISDRLMHIAEAKEFKITEEGKVLAIARRKEGFSKKFNKLIKLEEGKSIEELETIDTETNETAYQMTTSEAYFFLEKALCFLGDFSIGENVVYTEKKGTTSSIEDELREVVEMAIFMDDKQEYLALLAEKLGMNAIAEEARSMEQKEDIED